MWTVWSVRAVAAEAGGLDSGLIPAVWTFLGIVVITLGSIAVQSMKARSERSIHQPMIPAGVDSSLVVSLAREQGQLEQRVDDHDEAIDQINRRRTRDRKDLDAILTYLDCNEPGWRN